MQAPPPPPSPVVAKLSTVEAKAGIRTTITPMFVLREPADKSLSRQVHIGVTGLEKEIVKTFRWETVTEPTQVTKFPVVVSGEAKGSPETVTELLTKEVEVLLSQKFRPTAGLVFFVGTEEVTPFVTGNFSYIQPLNLGLNRIKVTAAKKHITTYTVPVTREVLSTAETTASISAETLSPSPETQIMSIITYEVLATEEARVFRYKPFKDVPPDFWALEPVAFTSSFGVIQGYPDETFRPENGITRAELTLLLMKTVNIDWSLVTPEPIFKDVPELHWAAAYIQEAVKQGVVTGYPNGNFEPKKVLTRAEGITILTRFASIEEGVSIEAQPFDDVAEAHWVNKHLQKAKAKGLLRYIKGRNFMSNAPFTRAEATEVLFRLQPFQDKVNLFWEQGMDAVMLTLPKPTQPPAATEESKKDKKPKEEEAPKEVTPPPQEEKLQEYEHPIF
jgi:hypothetical protein